MANKSDRRRKARAQKRSAKEQRMVEHGEGKSKYALKYKQQAKGNFLPTSPFYLTPVQKEEALRCVTNHQILPSYARVF